MWELLLGSMVLAVFHLAGELLIERTRRATICEVARTIRAGGLVVEKRGSSGLTVIQVPGLGLSQPGAASDQIVV